MGVRKKSVTAAGMERYGRDLGWWDRGELEVSGLSMGAPQFTIVGHDAG